MSQSATFSPRNFNSRPHGGRLLQHVAGYIIVYFNSRPHGGRQFAHYALYPLRLFQLTPSRRATASFFLIFYQFFNFNSRPHGGRQEGKRERITTCYFNSRPHGGRLTAGELVQQACNFNSRPHGGRPERSGVHLTQHQISTHALTEGDSGRSCTT